MKVYLKTLGCDKNTVDSEFILGILRQDGYSFVDDPYESDIVIINTCSFILDAKLESIDSITEIAVLKEHRPELILIVVGCLSERYADELLLEIPEIDAMLGAANFMDISELISSIKKEKKQFNLTGDIHRDFTPNVQRILTTPPHYSYLKIAEGCDNRCSYCIIPYLKGKFRSRTIDSLVKEAEFLAKNGIKEIMVIAQDVSRYGLDFKDGTNLARLLTELNKVEGIEWIRLHYLYPDIIDEDLLYTIQKLDKVVKYFDMPFQHISDNVLKRMHRNIRSKAIKDLVKKIREIVPTASIRTTFIVGFPGETEEDFNELLDFINEYKLERVGVFKFSREEGTPSYKMKDQVPEAIKETRFLYSLMAQEEISAEHQQNKIGKVMKVLIDEFDGERYIGRTYCDAPDIDGVCFVSSEEKLNISEFYDVEITDADVYDLIGRKI